MPPNDIHVALLLGLLFSVRYAAKLNAAKSLSSLELAGLMLGLHRSTAENIESNALKALWSDNGFTDWPTGSSQGVWSNRRSEAP